ncbi:MAG: hypothetical protein KJP16_06015 [Gammaproteobacteria bacterium]|nr:hypothetical protein [Gammaproteobacteria bacterium]NNL50358.1 hypothetical protein [Woeseiaceae bacterium]
MITRNLSILSLLAMLFSTTADADVTANQLVKSRFSGAGKMLNVFGGKAAKDGLEIQIAVGGDRKATKTGKHVEVIDLEQQMIWRYSVNRKGKAKKCKATTFDEFREQLAAMQDLPFFGTDGSSGTPQEEAPAEALQYEVTLNFSETGEQETHAGMTGDVFEFEAVAHRPGLPVEEGGGVIETTFVIGEKTAAWTEMQSWDKKWSEVVGEMTGMGDNLVKILASSPALQQVMTELRSKESELDGAMLRMSMRLSTVPDPRVQEQAEAEDSGNGDDIPTSLGGLGSKLGGALLKKKRDSAKTKEPKELYSNEVVITGLSSDTSPLLMLPDSCTG